MRKFVGYIGLSVRILCFRCCGNEIFMGERVRCISGSFDSIISGVTVLELNEIIAGKEGSVGIHTFHCGY